MRKQLCFVVLFLCSLLPSVGISAQSDSASPRVLVPAEQLTNLGQLKLELKRYHDCTCVCGCYSQQLNSQAQRAVAFLDRRVQRKRPGEKLAMVLDIDETALSNYQEILSDDFGYKRKDFDAWVESGRAPAIPGTLRLYQEARRLGVSVFFITGRNEAQRVATETDLKTQGYSGWQGLILRSAKQASEPTIAFKSAARKAIAGDGYRIILNVGDQSSDLKGTPQAELSVKLPNPFYYIP